MALYTLSGSDVGVWEKQLAANTVDTVSWEVARTTSYGSTVLAAPSRRVTVVNVSGAAAIYARADGVAPTVGGSGSYWLPAMVGASISVTVSGGTNPDDATEFATRVQLISSGTPTYSVMEDR